MHYLSHPEFSGADKEKIGRIRVDYTRPIGLIAKFKNPENNKEEWMLIDGNHRTRKAVEEGKPANYYVVSDPHDVERFMKFNLKHPHQHFLDDMDENSNFRSQASFSLMEL